MTPSEVIANAIKFFNRDNPISLKGTLRDKIYSGINGDDDDLLEAANYIMECLSKEGYKII